MEEKLVGMRTLRCENGEELVLSYYRLQQGKQYGAAVRTDAGEYAALPDITAQREKIDELLCLLMEGTVTPVTFQNVVEDWLAG